METVARPPMWLFFVLLWLLPVASFSTEQEPKFTSDFPLTYDFSNTTGGKLSCKASGQPEPKITWLMVDGSPVTHVPRLRQLQPDGTLVFPSFGIDDYRQDVHGVSYRCAASNSLGTIVSNEIKVKGVVNQVFDIHVYDVYTMKQNTAIMRCHIPKFLLPYVNITAWIKDSVVSIMSSDININSKYILLPSGELIIKDVDANDGLTNYRCQVLHRLTGEVKLSNTGRLIVTESQGKVPPRFIFSNSNIIIAKNERLFLPCVANGHPTPNYTWFKESMSGNYENVNENERTKIGSGLLVFESVHESDNGKYICTASNEVNSVKLTIQVTITESLNVVVTPSKSTVDANQEATLNCKISGSPIRDIIWFKDGKPLPKHDLVHVNNETVKISKMAAQHVGIYQCFAINDLYSSNGFGVIKLGDTMPIIVKSFEDKVLNPKEKMLLECTARGNPIPQFFWSLDNMQLNSSEHIAIRTRAEGSNSVTSSLMISNVNVDDGGVYRCIAKTKKGFVDHSSRINVYGKLGIRSNIKYQAIEDAVVQIDCPIYGYPIKRIQWEKDGRSVPIHIRHSVLKNGSLIIRNVKRNTDKGSYICTAINENKKSVKGEIELLVLVPPKISPFSFQDELIREGARARIQCVVREGDSPIEIFWFKDGHPLIKKQDINIFDIDEFSSILMISSINPRHNGNYTCLATNLAGADEHTTTLFINVAPKITPFTFPENVFEGRSLIRISCVIHQGDLPITFYWLKDGKSINSKYSLSIRSMDDYSSILTIENVEKKHSGNYTCVASNPAASVSHSSQLYVHVPPKLVPFSFQDEPLSEGTLVRVSCVVSRGDLPIKITWLKDDQVIPSALSVAIKDFDEYSSVLSIDPVKLKHAGNYTCIAQNSAGTSSHTAHLEIKVPLRWIIEPQDVTIKAGQKLLLDCQAEGFPEPTITWQKSPDSDLSIEKLELVKNDKNKKIFGNGTLLFDRVERSDDGFYICLASNSNQQSLSKFISIEVQAAPDFVQKEYEIRVKKGESVEIPCEAVGNWPIFYEWFVNNQLIDKRSTRYKVEEIQDETNLKSTSLLQISWADKKDSTQIICSAKNEIGESQLNVNLIVQENPAAPKIEVPIRVENQIVRLNWTLDYNGNSEITRYIIHYKKDADRWESKTIILTSPGLKTNETITDLKPATMYNFRIIAENNIGNSSFSKVVNAKTDETIPEGAPENIEVESIDANTLRVTWKPPKKHHWNGAIRGYNVGYKIHNSSDQFTLTNLEVPDDYTEELIYQLTDLHMYTQYDVIVQAYNSKGKGPSSDVILAMTSEDVPTSAPTEVRCSALSSKSIYILWDPPATDTIHGILRGYKVVYKPTEEWYDAMVQSKIVDSSKMTIKNLDVNTNYSIQVLAFTKVGDGVKSSPIFCKTHEDVPEPPEAIKVLPSSSDSVVVAWKPPHKSNGVLIKYNVYYKPIEDNQKIDIHTQNTQELQRNATIYSSATNSQSVEVKGLKKNKKYAFWVTANSAIGESSGSSIVAQTVADNIVPAKAASFDAVLKMPWQEDVVLPCTAVGVPSPNRKWTLGEKLLKENNRLKITSDGSVVISKIDSEDSGNYTCAVYNEHGRDQVTYLIAVQVPPSAPIMDVVSKTRSSIKLQWKRGITGGDSVHGYLLHYKENNAVWFTKEIRADQVLYTLDNLSCGASYQLYMEAFNNIGTGAPSDTITVTTEGSDVIAPSKDQIIREGSTFISIHLEAWPTTGCPVKSFSAEYKPFTGREWTLAGSNIRPSQKKLVISDLSPATWYTLRLSVESTSKPIIAEYKFATYTATGGTLAPDTFDKSLAPVYIFYLDPLIFIPAVALLIVVIIASVVVCFYFKRRSGSVGTPSDTTTNAEMNSWIRHSHTLPRGQFIRGQHSGRSTFARRSADPSPYATSHLTDHFHPDHGKMHSGAAIPLFHHESFQQSAQNNFDPAVETKFVFLNKSGDDYDPPPMAHM